MVSGLVTSPYDHSWISSGDASRKRMASKSTARLAGKAWESVFVDDGVDILLRLTRVPLAHFLLFDDLSSFQELNVQAQAFQFADQNIERFRNVPLFNPLALDDGLVRLGPARNVVGFDG